MGGRGNRHHTYRGGGREGGRGRCSSCPCRWGRRGGCVPMVRETEEDAGMHGRIGQTGRGRKEERQREEGGRKGKGQFARCARAFGGFLLSLMCMWGGGGGGGSLPLLYMIFSLVGGVGGIVRGVFYKKPVVWCTPLNRAAPLAATQKEEGLFSYRDKNSYPPYISWGGERGLIKKFWRVGCRGEEKIRGWERPSLFPPGGGKARVSALILREGDGCINFL